MARLAEDFGISGMVLDGDAADLGCAGFAQAATDVRASESHVGGGPQTELLHSRVHRVVEEGVDERHESS